MRVVVLDADFFDAFERPGNSESRGTRDAGRMRRLRGEIRKKRLHVVQRLPKSLQRLQILHVADMLAQHGVVFLCQAERILQFAAASQNLLAQARPGRWVAARSRGIGAGSARGLQKCAPPNRRRAFESRGCGAGNQSASAWQPRRDFLIAADDGFFGEVAGWSSPAAS